MGSRSSVSTFFLLSFQRNFLPELVTHSTTWAQSFFRSRPMPPAHSVTSPRAVSSGPMCFTVGSKFMLLNEDDSIATRCYIEVIQIPTIVRGSPVVGKAVYCSDTSRDYISFWYSPDGSHFIASSATLPNEYFKLTPSVWGMVLRYSDGFTASFIAAPESVTFQEPEEVSPRKLLHYAGLVPTAF